jgi:hypothetical protein
MKRIVLLFSVVLVSIIINACGGGGSGSSSEPAPKPAPMPTSVYSYGFAGEFVDTSTARLSGGGLYIYDPTSPVATVKAVDKIGIVTFLGVMHGSYDTASKTIHDIHTRSLVYVKGQNLFKVNMLRPGTPNPVQLSSESQADQICELSENNVSIDYANPDNTMVNYRLSGADAICGNADDIWRSVRMGMTATDAPLSAMNPPLELLDTNTGLSLGWAVVEGRNLVKYDQNFTNPAILLSAQFSLQLIDKAITANGTNLYLVIDGALHRYNIATNTLSASLHTFKGSVSNYTADASGVYFAEELYTQFTYTIYKLPHEGNVVPIPLFTGAAHLGSMAMTSNSIGIGEYNNLSPFKSNFKLISKNGALPAVNVATADALNFFAVGNKFFYNLDNSATANAPPVSSGIVNDDGSAKQEMANSQFAFPMLTNSRSILTTSPAVKRMLRAEGLPNSVGNKVKSYDPVTGAALLTLGTYAAPTYLTNLWFYAYSGDMASGYQSGPIATGEPGLKLDLYAVDTTKENSMVRLTNFFK